MKPIVTMGMGGASPCMVHVGECSQSMVHGDGWSQSMMGHRASPWCKGVGGLSPWCGGASPWCMHGDGWSQSKVCMEPCSLDGFMLPGR